uniref:Uncharacterized protein n=1 Tax=Arundo donax TaxID=35708 RepID=A0A0A9HWF6_ARUDO
MCSMGSRRLKQQRLGGKPHFKGRGMSQTRAPQELLGNSSR